MPHSTNQGGGMENFLLIKFYIISQRQWLLHVSSKNKLEMRQLKVAYAINKQLFIPLKREGRHVPERPVTSG